MRKPKRGACSASHRARIWAGLLSFTVASAMATSQALGHQAADPAAGHDPTPPAPNQGAQTTAGARAPESGSESLPRTVRAGRRVGIDPQTGRIVVPPAAERGRVRLSPRVLEAMSTSHQGLFEEVLPGGGVKVHLQGRFRNLLFVAVDEAGNLKLSHGPGRAAASRGHVTGHETRGEEGHSHDER